MSRRLEAVLTTFPIDGTFTISRGSKTQAEVITCSIHDGQTSGMGECVPYRRYDETIDGVMADILEMANAVAAGLDRPALQKAMKPGAARNAIDCALWDLEAKQSGISVQSRLALPRSAPPLVTAYTISLGDPDSMAAQAAKNSDRPLLKVKVGTNDDESRMRAVRRGAPDSAIIIDANEGWTDENIVDHLRIAQELKISLIEQPLPAGADSILSSIDRIVPICADESVHATGDLKALKDRYDAINIKLDKTGGLTEALRMRDEARRLGFSVMIGCMVGSSLAMAPAVLLAQGADFVDLDGPLLLARDREPGLRYEGSLVFPPEAVLWG